MRNETYLLRAGDPKGERLAKVAEDKGILLMMCDSCATERGPCEGGTRPEKGRRRYRRGRAGGCFPDLYTALSGNPPDQVIAP